MKIHSIKIFAALVIIITWLSYFAKFGDWFNFSSDTAVWGQFGDFLGGVINPLLTFISVVYLINSVNLQREANASLIALEEFKKTETKFYNMLESQRSGFESFKIVDSVDGKPLVIKDGDAVTYIEDVVVEMVIQGSTKGEISNKIGGMDKADNIFSIVRRFHNIIKLIKREIPENLRSEYYDSLVNMTEYKQICLILISMELFDWPILSSIDESGVFNIEALMEYRKAFRP
ncbi:hypothetical protein IGF73_004789 [Escherichia coli]|uniref:hypothetical protein n=1 Tax=Escherichia coli TaxID=562 RepID=UPI0002C99EA0|nr:hypothetical protein [Escherichia coli]EAC1946475.1 hypothetical protein [Escherichia coli]EEV5887013.1 hypothetical protein [Escherichia coli]EEV8603686.1 hypothetical protein [Escherichia coli]EEW0988597.1 hypothetical protein [Escherichia coli]EEW2099228.1 hypothetical protein [Escherichia coli]